MFATTHSQPSSAGTFARPVVSGSPEDEVGRGQASEVVVLVVVCSAGDLAQLVEAAGVREPGDPLADRQAPAVVLALDALGAAELLGERLAALEIVHLGLPVHGLSAPGWILSLSRRGSTDFLEGAYKRPPRMAMNSPVRYRGASATRNRTSCATSSGRPKRPIGNCARSRSRASSDGAMSRSISVSMTEGSTALTAMPSLASSRAARAVSASMPALLAA